MLSFNSQSCRAGRPGGTGRNPTTEVGLPPEHVDVMLGTVLGIVDSGGTHSLLAALSPTACWGPSTVGRGRPHGTQQGEPSEKGQPLSQPATPPLASISLTLYRAKQMRAVKDLTDHTYEQSHFPEVNPRTERRMS